MPAMMPSGVSPGWTMRLDRPSAQVEAETSQRLACALVRGPVGGAELVLDQAVLRLRVGYAQQRLGEHHQRQSLARRQAVFAEEVFDAAEPAGARPDALDQFPRRRVDSILSLRRQRGPREKPRDQGRVFGAVWLRKARNGRI